MPRLQLGHSLWPCLGELVQTTAGKWITHPRRCPNGHDGDGVRQSMCRQPESLRASIAPERTRTLGFATARSCGDGGRHASPPTRRHWPLGRWRRRSRGVGRRVAELLGNACREARPKRWIAVPAGSAGHIRRAPSRQPHLPRRRQRQPTARRVPKGKRRIRDRRHNGSLNGTHVNRKPAESVALANGDEIQMGKFRLVFLTTPTTH